jgi:hypothetical protein
VISGHHLRRGATIRLQRGTIPVALPLAAEVVDRAAHQTAERERHGHSNGDRNGTPLFNLPRAGHRAARRNINGSGESTAAAETATALLPARLRASSPPLY